MTENSTETSSFTSRLLDWYDVHQRDLPWRMKAAGRRDREQTGGLISNSTENVTAPADSAAPADAGLCDAGLCGADSSAAGNIAYHVWLSEIMLQQTRVEAVKGYYARFLEALPDIRSLAAAQEDVYLKLWEGLGYYSRVRNLHKGAVTIMEEYGGQMPETSEELRRIPGIGPYTAAAIASIAFGEAVPAVDGNLLRIYARLEMFSGDIRSDAARKAAYAYYYEQMQNCRRPGDFNQALMDLGSGICLPHSQPQCAACPLAKDCLAHREQPGAENTFPAASVKKPRTIEELTVFLIRDTTKIILRKRPPRGLLAGLYEFPNAKGHLDRDEAVAFVRSLGFEPLRIMPLPEAKHIFTHKEWHMTGYEIRTDELAGIQTDELAGTRADELAEAQTDELTGIQADVSAGTKTDMHDATKTGNAAGAKAKKDKPAGIILAELAEIREVYSIPSAFTAYLERI